MQVPHIQPFSGSYFLLDNLTVEPEPSNSAQANISEHLYGQIQHVYGDTRTPILLRQIDQGGHFAVNPVDDLPMSSIELPESAFDDLPEFSRPDPTDFLVAKPEQAMALQERIFGSHPSEDAW